MESEKIEKALKWLDEQSGFNIAEESYQNVSIIQEYIKVLRAKVIRLQQYDEDRDRHLHARLIKETRESTAQEIFNMLYNEEMARINIEYAYSVKKIAEEEYGIKIDE